MLSVRHFLGVLFKDLKMTNKQYVAVVQRSGLQRFLSFLFDEQLFRARRVHAIKWLLFEQLMNILTN